MSSAHDVFCYYVPTSVLSEIFSNLLALEDISRFDVAICNKNRRIGFLDYLGSKTSVFLGDRDRDLSSHALSWLKTRSIKVRSLKCNRVTAPMAVNISHIGNCLDWLSIGDDRIVDSSIAKMIAGCVNLQHLDLSYCHNITDDSIKIVTEGIYELQSLSLSECRYITDNGINMIAEKCRNLRHLNLSQCIDIHDLSENMINLRCYKITNRGISKIAQNCPNLCHLNLSNCRTIGDSSMEIVAERCHSLESLDLTMNSFVTDESIKRIAKVNLRKLVLFACRNITDVSICMVAERCLNMQFLNLFFCSRITDASIIMVAVRCLNIQFLSLSSCSKITDASINMIAEQCLDLETLDLTCCEKITRPCVINVVRKCRKLQCLGLSNNDISCLGEFNSGDESSLTEEDDAATVIREESLIEIAEAWPNSHHLHIKYCSSLDEDTANHIREECPNIDITFYF